jgi:molecular chaperone GrpE (heat shock protein)
MLGINDGCDVSGNQNDGNGSEPPQTAQEELSNFDAVAAAAELAETLGTQADPVQGEQYVRMLESEIESLNVLLRQKDELIKRADERANRAQEEVERSKERLSRKSARELPVKSDKLIIGFLDVLDDLDRSIDSARASDHAADFIAGVELVRKEFLAYLSKLGITKQTADGQRFDPEAFEAISLIDVTEDAQDGLVIGVARAGYLHGERVRRPARVAVGKKS